MFLEWRTVPSPHRDRRYGSNNSPVRLGGVWVEQMHKKDKFQTAGQVEKILSTYFFFFFFLCTHLWEMTATDHYFI